MTSVRFWRVIRSYQSAVRDAIDLLRESGIQIPSSCNEWVSLDIDQIGDLIGGGRYFKHGFGVAVSHPRVCIDFDFGLSGEIDGFDPGRLEEFVSKRLDHFAYTSPEEFLRDFQAAADLNLITREEGELLYYIANL